MKQTIWIFLTGTVLQVKGQELRLAGLEYFNYPQVRLKEVANGQQASFREMGGYVNYPKRLKNNKTFMINGISYAQVQATVENSGTGGKITSHFHRITYNFTLIHPWKKYLIIGRLSPTLASDFKDKLNIDDFMMQGSLIISRKYNSHFTAGAGLLYTTRLGKPMVLPGLQLVYKQDKHNLNIFLPAFINYFWSADAKGKWNIGARMGVNGANFNTSSSHPPYGGAMERLNYSRANMGAVVNYQLSKMLLLEAFGGYSTLRTYQFTDVHDNRYKYNSKDGMMFNIGFHITPPKK